MPKTVYRSLTTLGLKSGKCGCGIVRKRTERFSQTVNPYNRNADGSVKSIHDISREINAHRDAWMEAPIYCADCKPTNAGRNKNAHASIELPPNP